jgi:hypothetical protein
LKPRKMLENARTPTSRVHAVLGAGAWRSLPYLLKVMRITNIPLVS